MKNNTNKNLSKILFIFVIVTIITSYTKFSSNDFNKSIQFNKTLEKANIDPLLIQKVENEFPKILSKEYNIPNEEIKKIINNSTFEELFIKEIEKTNLFNKEVEFSFTGNIIIWKSENFVSILDINSENFYSKNDILKPVSNPKITVEEIKPYKIDYNQDIIKLNATVNVKLNSKKNTTIETINHTFIFE